MTARSVLPMICVGLWLAGCGAPTGLTSGPEDARTAWPQQLAGRALQTTTDEFVLYCNDAQTADSLQRWVTTHQDQFRTRYGGTTAGPGLVMAIEPGREPFPAIEQWRKLHPGVRGSNRTWTRRILFSIRHRPYCAAKNPYFRESFSIPYDEARGLNMFVTRMPRPAWICFLTTDPHFSSAFEEGVRLGTQRREEQLKRVSFRTSVANLPAMPFLALGRWIITFRSRSIDADLMHLDRRETLFNALIGSRFRDANRRSALRKALGVEIDEQWMSMWRRRPID